MNGIPLPNHIVEVLKELTEKEKQDPNFVLEGPSVCVLVIITDASAIVDMENNQHE